MQNVEIIDHPLADHVLSRMRDKRTRQIAFRKGLVKLGRICGYEIIRSMPTREVPIETPLEAMCGLQIDGMDDIVVINVLRAATHLVEGLIKAFPKASQGVISASRNEEAGRQDDGSFPIEVQYKNFPKLSGQTVIVADPMLASGSTMVRVLEELFASGRPQEVIVLSVVSAPEGIERVRGAFPDVRLITVALDSHLDERGYIVPGLGDAGDRAFGS